MTNLEVLKQYWSNTDIDQENIRINEEGRFFYKNCFTAKYDLQAGVLTWVKPGTISNNKSDSADMKKGFRETATFGESNTQDEL